MPMNNPFPISTAMRLASFVSGGALPRNPSNSPRAADTATLAPRHIIRRTWTGTLALPIAGMSIRQLPTRQKTRKADNAKAGNASSAAAIMRWNRPD